MIRNSFEELKNKYKEAWDKLFLWCEKKFKLSVSRRKNIYCNQYEVWMSELGENIGSEMNKLRPVIIVSKKKDILSLNTLIVVPLSSREIKKKKSEVIISSRISGVERDSVAVCHQIRCIDKMRLIRKIGKLKKEELLSLKEIFHTMFLL